MFVALLWLWHSAGLSTAYHNVLAGFLDALYPALDPTGVVHGVALKGHEFMLRLLVGENRTGLAINAEDITSNLAMLLALYLSSPMRRRWRLFVVSLAGAIVVLFLLHAVTVITVSQYAFLGHPQIAPLATWASRWRGFLVWYNAFFEAMGMYLYALVLWLPYFLVMLRGTPGNENGRPAPADQPSENPVVE